MTVVILKSNYRDARDLFDTLKDSSKSRDLTTFYMLEKEGGRVIIIWDLVMLIGLRYDFLIPDSDIPVEWFSKLKLLL